MNKTEYTHLAELKSLREKHRPALIMRITNALERWPESEDTLKWVQQDVNDDHLGRPCSPWDADARAPTVRDSYKRLFIHHFHCARCRIMGYELYDKQSHDRTCECRTCLMAREVEDITQTAAALRFID